MATRLYKKKKNGFMSLCFLDLFEVCVACVCVTCALPGKLVRTIPGRSLLCMAVAETICAEDMVEML